MLAVFRRARADTTPEKADLPQPIAHAALLAGALALALAACGKTPDSPVGPGRAAPKTSVPMAPADPVGIMPIPASPAEEQPALLHRPVRIWV